MLWLAFPETKLFIWTSLGDKMQHLLIYIIQEFSYRQQIARQLRTQYAEGIYRHKYYTVTFKVKCHSM